MSGCATQPFKKVHVSLGLTALEIRELLPIPGHDADRVLREASSDAVARLLRDKTAAAIRLNLPGVPG